MVSFALFFTLGVWYLQQQASLPILPACWPFAILVLLIPRPHTTVLAITRRIALLVCAFLLGYTYSAWMAQRHLADSLPDEWQGKNIEIIGTVADMPRPNEHGQSFAFDVESVQTISAHVPSHILLSTYNTDDGDSIKPAVGERWQFTVRLKQPHGTSNPNTFDFEIWSLERNIRAVGYIYGKGDNHILPEQSSSTAYLVQRLREKIRTHILHVLGDTSSSYAGILIALAVGDQSSIPQTEWRLFTDTGVNHLMSISGLHITMLAGLIFSIVYWLWRRSIRLTLWFPARKAAALAGLAAALFYTLLSGYEVPAQRTLYMVATFTAMLLFSRNISPSQLLCAALLVVLLADPWAVLAPGFWLSFGAVAFIFYVTANRLGKGHWLKEYGKVQWAMMIGLIPLLLALFQQMSLVSPIANAFAIPLVSFVVVPLTLLGTLPLFEWALYPAHQAMALCMFLLEQLHHLPYGVWTQHTPPAWTIIIGLGGALWILAPRGFPLRYMGSVLLLPMFLVMPTPPATGNAKLIIFDVGQGLSVVLQTHDHVLLYDTGPDFSGDSDSGNRILVPALRGMGIAHLDELMLTHDDTDHTGGASSVIQAFPIDLLASSLPDDSPILQQAQHLQQCSDGQQWDWDGVHFEVLHPALASYNEAIHKNDRGCTLRISTGKHSVLLTADIEKLSEQRLLALHANKLPATLLVAPHHGSKTSSTPAFVDAVHPRYVVFTAGYRNRFGHPKEEVLARYQAVGSELLRSDEDGAISILMSADTFEVERYRKTHARYWQQHAISGTQDS